MKKSFSQQLLSWYDRHGRKNLPWQKHRSAYTIWLSEIMLQQTRVATVIPYFERFIKRFPDVSILAAASNDEVMSLWAGLGYYARARNAHRCAQIVRDQYAGVFPELIEVLMTLPGIGRSTAGAIVAQAFDQRAVILDGNVKRVLTRLRAIPGWPGKSSVQKQLWTLADELTPDNRPADYTQAIMDLGAMICVRQKPECRICPVSQFCMAFQQDQVTAFPERRPQKPLPVREVSILLCHQQDGRILLERRPPDGIWGGLWSLPECDVDKDPAGFLESAYGYRMLEIDRGEPLSHTFTHFHLNIRPFLIKVQFAADRVANDNIRWCRASDLQQMGLPKPVAGLVSNFLQQAI